MTALALAAILPLLFVGCDDSGDEPHEPAHLANVAAARPVT